MYAKYLWARTFHIIPESYTLHESEVVASYCGRLFFRDPRYVATERFPHCRVCRDCKKLKEAGIILSPR